MKEIKDIIRAFDVAQQEGKQTALATVVHLQGSAYRRPGARMLVTIDGKLTGAISGGCLEGDALRKAQLAMVQKKPMLVTYDTTDDDDNTLGVGLGCNGIISILIEPIDQAEENNPVNLLKLYTNKRQAAVLVTLFSLNKRLKQPGTCLLYTGEMLHLHSAMQSSIPASLKEHAMQVIGQKKSAFTHYPDSNLTAFVEYLHLPVSLLVFGAGNDSIPMVQMASLLGWETTVVDGRGNYANRERFPAVSNLIVAKPEEAVQNLQADERTVAALMTHNYNYDIAILRQLLYLPVPYIAVLGPHKKMQKMLEELRATGVHLDDARLNKIFGPAGLDIGTETSEEIALSIIAEIQAVLAKRQGTFLRNKNVSIHAPETVEPLINTPQ